MSYKPLSGYRKLVAAYAIGAFLGLAEPTVSHADDLIENNNILTSFGKICTLLVQKNGNKFEYEINDVDVNGDGKPDKIRFKLRQEEFITKVDNSGTVDGPRLDASIDIGDVYGSERKIYAIVKGNGEVSICKSRNLGEKGKDVEPYLDVLIKHLENEINSIPR